MVTGDAALTALHVAREVGICEAESSHPALVLKADSKQNGDDGGGAHWVSAMAAAAHSAPVDIPFGQVGLDKLAQKYSLLTTEDNWTVWW